jgi:small subunit ribosomal protein S8
MANQQKRNFIMSMTSTDPIADMLTRIRNAALVRKQEVSLPHSKAKQAVAELLKQSGFIANVATEDARVGKTLTITVSNPGEPVAITSMKRLSKPGLRQYVRSKEIPTVKRGRGIVIVSTSKGVMSGTDAKQQGIGGELICEVY